MKNKINLIGQKFTRLFVIEERISPNYKGIKWKCICDCGNETIVNSANDLLTGNTKSCGCLRSEIMSKNATKRNFNNRKFEPKIAVANRVFKAEYSDGDLTLEQFLDLSQQNCHYCNKSPSNKRKINNKKSSEYYNNNANFIYNGLDRIDNSLPHHFANCVPCCKYCNYAKRERNYQEFLDWIKNIATNLNILNK